MQIKDRVAVVSGGASGLGAAAARHLTGAGARVAILDRNAEAAATLAADLGGIGLGVDITVESQVVQAMDHIAAELGTPRIALNTAGIADAARIVGRDGATSVALFRRVIEVNLIGSYTVMSHAVRHMAEAEPLGEERGVVINTASIAYEDGQFGQSAYAASKGGIASMTLPAARELARPGIRVMTIAPGVFATPMMAGLSDEVTAGITANIPHPARLGDPDEYARLVAHIVENAYLNGTVLRLDGAVRLPQR